ncbi:hypothetical protein niasHT_039493 [Heterodera trifolii]|uniref:Uncharacterized protein n=1 Tax=Heterodera trifolii TaxID=157864 RepID=A0ABD2HZ30_9BILA
MSPPDLLINVVLPGASSLLCSGPAFPRRAVGVENQHSASSSSDTLVGNEVADMTNGFTHEHLTLKRMNYIGRFLLIRCPIVRDESKWTKWGKEAIDWKFFDQWNQIGKLHAYREDEIMVISAAPNDQ